MAPFHDRRAGFTIFELVIFSAIFTLTAVSFITILLSMTRIQLQQGAAAEVTQQSQFLLQTIQRYVEQSSLIEMPSNTATTTLKLRMSSSTYDPTYIYLTGTTLYLKETDAGVAQALTSSKVQVASLSFQRKENAGGRDAVAVSFTLAYNNPNSQSEFVHGLSTSLARTSAAVFASNILPSVATTYKLGSSTGDWRSVNDTIYFTGASAGFSAPYPQAAAEVSGGLRLNTATTRPACGSSNRGMFWVVQNGVSVADTLHVCAKDAADAYAWRAATAGTGNTFTIDSEGTLATNLIAYWKLNETSGSRADYKGGNTLSDNNTVTSNPGKQDVAAQFANASSEYLSIADNAALSTGNISFTLAGWFFLDSEYSNFALAGKHETLGEYEYLLYYDGADRFRFAVSSTGTSTVEVIASNHGAVATNSWTFIAAWHDSVNDRICISVSNGTANCLVHSDGVRNGTSPFQVGRYAGGNYFAGRADELGFWKKVLTSQERTDLYNSGAGNTYNP